MRKMLMACMVMALMAVLPLGVAGCQSAESGMGETQGGSSGTPSSEAGSGSTPDGQGAAGGGAAAGEEEVVAWSAGADCMLCHETQCAERTAYHETVACADCHVEDDAFAAVHGGATSDNAMPKRLKKTEVSQETCEGCHGDYSELAAKTQDVDVLTDNEGTTVNPHEVTSLDSSDHATITCASCHEEHTGEDATKTAPAFCLTCHHEGTYACYTCHD